MHADGIEASVRRASDGGPRGTSRRVSDLGAHAGDRSRMMMRSLPKRQVSRARKAIFGVCGWIGCQRIETGLRMTCCDGES